MFTKALRRTTDSYGSGHYGASRGERDHVGVDLRCEPNSLICSHVNGKITKIGYPYANDLSFRYIQITDARGIDHRFYYVEPLPNEKIGRMINIGNVIGSSQKLGDRYPIKDLKPIAIQEHVHYEVLIMKDGKKNYLDPNLFLKEI